MTAIRVAEVLSAVGEVLERVVAAQGQPDARLTHDARVAARLLTQAQRETALGSTAWEGERERLYALLGMEAREDLSPEALRAALCERITGDAQALDRQTLHDHLWQTALERLAIDNPAYRWRD